MGKIGIVWVRFGTKVGILGGSVILQREFSRRVRDKADISLVTHEVSYDWHRAFGVEAKPLHLDRTKWAWRQGTIASLYSMLITLLHSFKGRYHIAAARSHYLHDVLPALWIKLQAKAKLAVYVITVVVPEFGGWSLLNWLVVAVQHFLSILLIKTFSDIVFVLDPYDKETLVRFGIKPDKIRVTHGGVDLEKINSVLDIQDKEYDAVYFGRFSKSKGIYDLIDTWRLVTDKIPSARLLIFGFGTDEDIAKMNESIRRLELTNNIVIKGPMFGEEKYKMLKASKLYVNPSYVDTWCLATAEAAACRTTAVVYGLQTYKATYGDSIAMARTGDIRDFSSKILELLNDPELRRRKAEEAYERVQKYTWEGAVQEEFKALTSLLTDRN